MHRAKALLISVSNMVTWLALGALYSQFLQSVLSFLAHRWPQVMSSAEKVLLTGTSAAIAIAAVFAFNRLITRQSMLGVGVCCGLMAFVYFYIVRSWPDLWTVFLVTSSSYSFFALLVFTIAPALVGLLFHRTCKLSGLHVLLPQEQ